MFLGYSQVSKLVKLYISSMYRNILYHTAKKTSKIFCPQYRNAILCFNCIEVKVEVLGKD